MRKRIICIIVIAAQLAGCATYRSQSVSFRPPEDYGNYLTSAGVGIGAEAFADPVEAERAFGFNIRSAGVLPVQIVLDNRSTQGIEVVTDQTFLVDDGNRYWKVLSTREAVTRVDKTTQGGAIGSGAGKGAMLGAAAGSLLGLALGIVSGHRVGSAALKGGALGAAGGAIIGGASKVDDRDHESEISGDIREKRVEGKIFPAGSLANGFIFFPGEAASARELRLQIRFRATGAVETIMLPFKPNLKPKLLPVTNRPQAEG